MNTLLHPTVTADNFAVQQQRQAVATWWQNANHPDRAEALRLDPTEFLPEKIARDLKLHGVRVEDVSLAYDLRSMRRQLRVFVQPRVLQEFLASVRIWVEVSRTEKETSRLHR